MNDDFASKSPKEIYALIPLKNLLRLIRAAKSIVDLGIPCKANENIIFLFLATSHLYAIMQISDSKYIKQYYLIFVLKMQQDIIFTADLPSLYLSTFVIFVKKCNEALIFSDHIAVNQLLKSFLSCFSLKRLSVGELISVVSVFTYVQYEFLT